MYTEILTVQLGLPEGLKLVLMVASHSDLNPHEEPPLSAPFHPYPPHHLPHCLELLMVEGVVVLAQE